MDGIKKQYFVSPYFLFDISFVLVAALFSLAAYMGVLELTPDGVGMDSDLQNYAQILDWQHNPSPFSTDPIAPSYTSFPGVPNFQTILASFLGGSAPISLLRAGAIGFFLHLISFYLLGRWLFIRPSAALLLTVVMSITVYWAYGTFWGATHSDPVPRIFHASFWALLLIPGIKALSNSKLRIWVLFLAGLGVAIHTVNGLVAGAMFFMAFLLNPVRPTFKKHIYESCLSLAAFALPTLAFLLSLHIEARPMPQDELDALNKIWLVRFDHDWGHLWSDLSQRLADYCFAPPLFSAGLASFFFLRLKKSQLSPQLQGLLSLFPGFFAALTCVCLLVAAETATADLFHRPHMSQELLRGTRLLIPMAWFSITAAVVILAKRLPHVVLPILTLLVLGTVLLVSQDKQILAARYILAQTTGLQCLENTNADRIRSENQAFIRAMNALRKQTRTGELVFTDTNEMAVRYYAHLNLAPIFKDALLLFYSRDLQTARLWLRLTQLLQEKKPDVLQAWKESGAPLLLSRSLSPESIPKQEGKLLYSNGGWCLFRKS